ncbi:hypothetical protein F0562_028069 [Nyssa sinensis]|uniref:Putative plant transposon protein domain-containing protein n=1 Tax=Nyssa sinensis TaxID=561372 RepID=A0A5J5B562_9ASTE|nr:hypothetical protein F0562_028069 [Nyssa sinensis]
MVYVYYSTLSASYYGGLVSICHFFGSSTEESSSVKVHYCSDSSPCHSGSPIYEPLVREFYANLETVRNQVTARAFVYKISFYLTPTLIAKTLAILREDQIGFPYASGDAPREEVLAKTLRCDWSDIFRVIDAHLSQCLLSDDYCFLNLVVSYDLSLVSRTNTLTQSHSTLLYAIATGVPIDGAYVIFSTIDDVVSGQHTVVLPFGNVITRICVGQGVLIYTFDMVRELSGPFTKLTLIEFECHVGLVAVDVIEDMEAVTTEVGKVVPDDDYLVNQMPPQYRQDLSPPRPFYHGPGASSSSAPPLVT